MKYVLIIFFTCLFLNSNSQSLTVYDLSILNKINEIEWINYYLTVNKDYKYVGDFGENDDGWHVYKFTRGKDILEVDLGSGNTKEGNFIELTQVDYTIYDESAIKLFYTSIEKYKFTKKEEGKTENGNLYSLWIGNSNIHDALTIIKITKIGNTYNIVLF